jgi:hypothetical protein
MAGPRRYPTEDEVDAWIASHIGSRERIEAEEGVAAADQKRAAAEHGEAWIRAVAVAAVVEGIAPSAYINRRGSESLADDLGLRRAARLYLVAASEGIRPLCAHVNEVRPVALFCDPPVVVCQECLPSMLDKIVALGFRHDHECDLCGAQVEMLCEHHTNIGSVSIAANVCESCRDEGERWMESQPMEVVKVGRNLPCPCGSGKKYKHCHGAARRERA